MLDFLDSLRTDSTDDAFDGYRIDRGGLELRQPEKVDGGFIVEGIAARPGIYVYKNPDGSLRRELVTVETFRKSAPLDGRPTTLHHPAERRVDARNESRVKVGHVVETRIDDETGCLFVKFFVTDAAWAEAKSKGLRGLSPGYDVKLDRKPGVDQEHGAYDLRQVARVYNHLALCGGAHDPARGGQTTSMRVDSETEIDPSAADAQKAREKTMNRLLALALALGIRTDAVDTSDEDKLGSAVESGIQALKTERDTAVAERDTLQGRVDALEGAKLTDEQVEAERLTWFNERVDALEVAKRYGVEGTDTLTNAALKKAVAEKAFDNARTDASDDYYAAMFDAAKSKRAPEAGRGIKAPTDLLGGSRTDATVEPIKPTTWVSTVNSSAAAK